MGLNIVTTGADSSGLQLLYFVFHLNREITVNYQEIFN